VVYQPNLARSLDSRQLESENFFGTNRWSYVFDELMGMIISRRPNSLASRDKSPAPRQMTATAITADNVAVIGVSSGPTLDLGSQEQTLPTATIAAAKATNRVRNPIRSSKPAAIITETIAQIKNPSSRFSPK
jgi:hypothetical protein